MDHKQKFSQHPHDGTLSINEDEIIAIDISEDNYHAKVLTKQGKWVRLNKSYKEISSLLKK